MLGTVKHLQRLSESFSASPAHSALVEPEEDSLSAIVSAPAGRQRKRENEWWARFFFQK